MISFLFGGRRRLVLILIALLVILALNIVDNPIRSGAYKIFAPVQSLLWRAGDSVSDTGGGLFGGVRLKAENEALSLQHAALLQELAELTDIKKENEELRKILDFTLKEDFTIVEGEVLWKDPSQDVLVVRTGNGIESGMPVITPEKIAVGRVEEVMGEFSRIRLLSHTQSSIDVVVGEQRIGGVIKGEGRFKATIDLLPQEAVIEVGDVVLTSSLGGIFPKNFLVGRIGEVLQSDLEPFQRAVLDPSFDISLHRLLLIITNYTTH